MYTLEQLIAMGDETLARTAKQVFSMHLDPFSELGKRAMNRRLQEKGRFKNVVHISPALMTIIGPPSLVIENILNYQEVGSCHELQLVASCMN